MNIVNDKQKISLDFLRFDGGAKKVWRAIAGVLQKNGFPSCAAQNVPKKLMYAFIVSPDFLTSEDMDKAVKYLESLGLSKL